MNRAGATASRYTITDLGVLPGYVSVDVIALNEWGQVVGDLHTDATGRHSHAFLWHDGIMRDLGGVRLNSLNDGGEAVGTRLDGSGRLPRSEAVIFRSDGLITLFPDKALHTFGNAINDNGQVVGYVATPFPASRPQDFKNVAFIWEDGQVHELPLPTGHRVSEAIAINAKGVVVGVARYVQLPKMLMANQAVLWDADITVVLGGLPEFEESKAVAINGLSQVLCIAMTGVYSESGTLTRINSAPFLWHEGQARRLGLWSAADLNDSGQVVGWQRKPSGYVSAALWQDDVATDLNHLIPRNLSWRLTHARAINNHGWIAGTGTHHGEPRAFLLTPGEDA